MGIEDPKDRGKKPDRRASTARATPGATANSATPRDPVSGQKPRTVREALGDLTVARLEKLSPEQRQELLQMLSEETVGAASKVAS